MIRIALTLWVCIGLSSPHPARADDFRFSAGDKQKHLAASSGITLGSSYILKKTGTPPLQSTLYASLISISLGLAKEYLVDPQPSRGDLIANGIGTALGAGATLTFNF